MALTVLVEAKPMRADSGAPVVVRLAGLGSRAYTHAGVNDWWAGIEAAPRFTSILGFGQRGWTGGAIPTTGAITFSPSDRARVDALSGLVWVDAEITIWTGDDAAADPAWTTELKGTVAGVTMRDGSMTIIVADLSNRLNGPIVTGRFAGSGGIEGGTEARERIKRRSFGACWGVEARLIDKAANIYEVGDPARPLAAIDAVKDRGRSGPVTIVGWAGSLAATFDALKAAAVPEGGAAVAPSIACVKWWTQPSAPLTVDLRGEIGTGYVDTVAEIAERIAGEAGLPTIDVAAATAIRPGQAGLHVDGDGDSFAQALDQLLLRASLLWLLEPAGAVRLAPIGYDAAAPIVDAVEAAREASYKPVTRLVLGYRRNHRLHNDGEIAAAVLESGDGTYADGTPIEELRPAQRGADVTGANTAAALFGQGALATMNTLANGGPYLTGFGALSGLRYVRFGGNAGDGAGIYNEAGTEVATEPGYRTAIGVASGIFGQGLLATLNALANGSQYLTGFGALSRFTGMRFGGEAGNFAGFYDEFGNLTTDNGYKTAIGIASGIFGQGALATTDTIGSDSQLSGLIGLRLLPYAGDGRYLAASRMAWDVTGGTVQDLKPGEAGANVTEARVAAAIFGQGWGATASEAAASNARVATGVNTVIDSGFARRLEMFDYAGAAPGLSLGLNLFDAGPGGYWGKRQVAYLHATSLAIGQEMDFAPLGRWGQRGNIEHMRRYCTPIALGDRVGVRALAAPHRCDAALFLLVFDREQNLIVAHSSSYPTSVGGGLNGENMQSREIIWTCDYANAAYFCLMVRGEGRTQAWDDPYLFISEPWQGKLATGQTVLPPYAPGPADALADRTKDNTAAGIAGQSAWATWSTIAPTLMAARTSNLQDDGNIQAAYVYRPGFGAIASYWPQEAGANVTEGRTAAALFGQGAFATISQIDLTNTDRFTHGGRFASSTYGAQWFQASNVAWGFGTGGTVQEWKPGEPGANVTETRTAGGIAGQGALATANTIVGDSQLGGEVAQRLSPYAGDGRYLAASRMAWDVTGGTVQQLKPGEAGANVTEGRTAAAIAGQSYLATSYPSRLHPSPQYGAAYLAASAVAFAAGETTESLRPGESGANRTEGRTAAALFGQGAFATISQIDLTNTDRFTHGQRFAAASYGAQWFQASNVAWGFGTGGTVEQWKPGEPGANVTEGRTAAAIAGQSHLATNYPGRLHPSPQHGEGYLAASAVAFAAGETTESLRPGESGANRTEGRTAAAISGQGAFATAPQIGSWNVASYYNFSAFKLDYSITRSDGVSVVTEALAITNYGVAAAIAGQGTFATKSQAGAGDLAAGSVQRIAYTVLAQNIQCAVGN